MNLEEKIQTAFGLGMLANELGDRKRFTDVHLVNEVVELLNEEFEKKAVVGYNLSASAVNYQKKKTPPSRPQKSAKKPEVIKEIAED